MRKLGLALLLLPLFVSAASAQPSNCSDGTVYDDGVYEQGSGFNEVNVGRGSYVMRFDPPSLPAQLESVCVCWIRQTADSTITFDINVWAADGPGGQPGTLLGKVAGQQASSVTSSITGSFYRYNLSSAGIVATGPVYIGPSWAPRTDTDFFICEDQSAATPDRPVFVYASSGLTDGTPTLNPRLVNPFLSALGIRAKFGAPASSCIPSPTALCLNNGRFRVEATFQTSGGQPGQAQVVKLTDETGYLWFFNASNVEAVIKVLNACSLNQRFWVFAGGLTDVRTVITVTDTQTGAVKSYINPQGTPFQPIQDTGAFATCP